MSELAIAALGLLLLLWAISAGWFARLTVTGPIAFVVAGYLLANPDWGVLTIDVEAATVHAVAEITLALVLFVDAAGVNTTALRRDLALPTRLLVVALPLAMVLGTLLALGLFPEFPWALAAFVGAALAPTDASLSVQVIEDERIPRRWRRTLNVESGLNDGIATPIVVLTLAAAASQLGVTEQGESVQATNALLELAIGVGVGIGVGALGARLLVFGSQRGWTEHGGRQLAAAATAVTAFAASGALDGNGFITAFVAGLVFGAILDRSMPVEETLDLTKLGGELLALVVWFVFGAALVPLALASTGMAVVGYALASLTLIRMVPVALSLLGAGLDRDAVATIGWFGPRGLASVVFAILAFEQLEGGGELVGSAIGVVTMTILFSVVLHGATATPWVRRLQATAGGVEEHESGQPGASTGQP